MSSFLTHLHDDLRGTRLTRRGAEYTQASYSEGNHKIYPRMTHIDLPKSQPLLMPLTTALEKRQSANAFSVRPLSLLLIGNLLGHAVGMNTHKSRQYPSAGALYPIETYLIGRIETKTTPHVFHYHPHDHALEVLWELPRNVSLSKIIPLDIVTDDNAVIIFTSRWQRSSAKYGDFAYTHCLIEAGHMAENVLLAATALEVPSRPIAGFVDDTVREALDIDPEEEQPIYAIVL